MKIQKHKIGTKKNWPGDYYKYVVVLPKNEIEKAGFKVGEELEAEIDKEKHRIILKRKQAKNSDS